MTVIYEGATVVVGASFSDENDVAITPKSITWSLFGDGGRVINSRENVSASVAASVNIVLTGDDLALANKYDRGFRTIEVKAVYDSSLGNNLVLRSKITFSVVDMMSV